METKRLQEEEDEIEQCLPQDDQGWPPLNTIRPWRSAPPTPPHSRDNTALGPRSASMLSLQTELFLDLVAEAQSKRLEGQRATFHTPPGSLTTASASVQVTEDRDQLYSTILSHQVRSEAPYLPLGGQNHPARPMGLRLPFTQHLLFS
uniref:G protein signaling modulator 3 n=1 Tax=Monodelphis domestica TaxID=13616 RepID=A0A5F8GEW4_MONDO